MKIKVFRFHDGMYLGKGGRLFGQPIPPRKTDGLFYARQFESDDDIDYLSDLNGRLVTLKITVTEVKKSSTESKHKVKKPKKVIDELIAERAELVGRRQRLGAFIDKHLEEVSDNQQIGMRRQFGAMKIYIQALDERLADLNTEAKSDD